MHRRRIRPHQLRNQILRRRRPPLLRHAVQVARTSRPASPPEPPPPSRYSPGSSPPTTRRTAATAPHPPPSARRSPAADRAPSPSPRRRPPRPPGSPATNASALAATPASISRTIDGRKPGCTNRRYRVCTGGSVCIIVGGESYDFPISSVKIPCDEQNASGSVPIDATSGCVVTAQNPPARSSGSCQATGADSSQLGIELKGVTGLIQRRIGEAADVGSSSGLRSHAPPSYRFFAPTPASSCSFPPRNGSVTAARHPRHPARRPRARPPCATPPGRRVGGRPTAARPAARRTAGPRTRWPPANGSC